MNAPETVHIGVGFVTGRKNFRKVLRSYIYRWKQTSSEVKTKYKLHLFVAYDLEYNNTQVEDYINIRPDVLDILDSVFFISKSMIQKELVTLEDQGVVSRAQAAQVFDKGYAGKRNAILYYALKKQMDHLIFLDDDEYPLAVTKTGSIPLWSGQDVFAEHMKGLKQADITNGYHCGYISPIPYIQFNGILTEHDFQLFIEAISNDILEWDKIRQIMINGGVTYAQPSIFIENQMKEVPEIKHTKFISGSNLGINLTNPQRVYPFFNPPKARGEDTFLSACLSERKVLRIPCYTFHDGFSVYDHLLDGVLPLRLKHINADNEKIIARFYRACVGWVRYKPLYLFITDPEHFMTEIDAMREKLSLTLPKLCQYFNMPHFMKIAAEFESYCRMVPKHHRLFLENQDSWAMIRAYATEQAY